MTNPVVMMNVEDERPVFLFCWGFYSIFWGKRDNKLIVQDREVPEVRWRK